MKVIANKVHNLHKHISDAPIIDDHTPQRIRRAPSLSHIKTILVRTNLSSTPIHSLEAAPPPPWTIQTPNVNKTMIRLNKKETTTQTYTQKFKDLIQVMPERTLIYTDGSVTTEGAGCAVIAPSYEESWKIDRSASVVTTELSAIWKAVELCEPSTWKEITICSDSINALRRLENVYSKDTLTKKILSKLHTLRSTGADIQFMWIPGHVGLGDNEKADRMAKEAAGGMPTSEELLPAVVEDLKMYIKKKARATWELQWQNCTVALRDIRRSTAPFPFPKELVRKEKIILTRLAIGHTRLTHEHLLVGQRPPRCPLCGIQLTVQHILIDCPNLQQKRIEYHINETLPDLLSNVQNCDKLLAFLKNVGLYTKL